MKREGLMIEMRQPFRLELEVTRRCPYNCIHCSVAAGIAFNDELSLKTILKLISDFPELGGEKIVITGGEPLIRGEKFLETILHSARSNKIGVLLYTSGHFLSYKIAEIISKFGVEKVCISIEGSEVTHDKITGFEGSYRIALNSIQLLKKFGIPIRIHFTPMRINYLEIDHVYEIAKTLGIDDVKIFSFVPQGRGFDNKHKLVLSPLQKEELVKKILLLRKEIKTDIGGTIEGLADECSLGKKLIITCNGDVLPCLGLRDIDPIFGNIKTESLKEIWYRLDKLLPRRVCLCRNRTVLNQLLAK